jgi:hypothetical protein
LRKEILMNGLSAGFKNQINPHHRSCMHARAHRNH